MDTNVYLQQIASYLPNLLIALAILVVGWLLALIVSRLVANLLSRTNLDERVASAMSGGAGEPAEGQRFNTERWISGAVFWLIMLFVIVAFLNQLNLAIVSQPLNTFLTQVLGYIPGLIGGLVLLFIAWVIATALRLLIIRLLSSAGWLRRLSTDAQVEEPNRQSIAKSLGNIVYWLVFLLFLPAILDALNMEGILLPVQGLVDEILGFLPNLLGAVVIFIVGFLVARIVRQIVTNILAGLGIDTWLSRAGVTGAGTGLRLSEIIGTVIYVLILIPVVIAALNALNIPAISQPAANMLNNLLLALPSIFGVLLLIALAFFVGRVVGRFVTNVLTSLGFDNLFNFVGLFRTGGDTILTPPSAEPVPGETSVLGSRMTPSDIVGYLVNVAIILFAVMEGANLIGFGFLAEIVSDFIVAAGQVIIGLIVLAIGLWLASVAERFIRSSGTAQANILAPTARIAIIVFSGALALRQMGIAEDIVNLAFGLLLGAVAVAAALAFGLGGREVASRQLERWQSQLRRVENEPPPPPATPPTFTTPGTPPPPPGVD